MINNDYQNSPLSIIKNIFSEYSTVKSIYELKNNFIAKYDFLFEDDENRY